MKIRPEHLRMIMEAFETNRDAIVGARADYKEGGLSERRYLWDTFGFAKVGGDSARWACDTLYPYGLNDSHIETAIKAAFKRLDLEF